LKIIPTTIIVFPALSQASGQQQIDSSLFYLPANKRHLMPLLVKAAKKVKQNPRCLEITDGSISSQRSTPNNPVFFVTCRIPKTRAEDYANFYVSKQEWNAPGTPDLPKPIDAKVARDKCAKFITECATFPSTVSFSWFGTTLTTAVNGNTRVVMDFEAKNALGAKLPYRAVCLVLPNGKLEGHLTPR
jgi:hypothetical protein